MIDRRIEQSINVAVMRNFMWMSGVTRKDRKKNKYVRSSIIVVSIVDKMRENSLGWFGQVMR
jgi:hypothetical protein